MSKYRIKKIKSCSNDSIPSDSAEMSDGDDAVHAFLDKMKRVGKSASDCESESIRAFSDRMKRIGKSASNKMVHPLLNSIVDVQTSYRKAAEIAIMISEMNGNTDILSESNRIKKIAERLSKSTGLTMDQALCMISDVCMREGSSGLKKFVSINGLSGETERLF